MLYREQIVLNIHAKFHRDLFWAKPLCQFCGSIQQFYFVAKAFHLLNNVRVLEQFLIDLSP